MHRFRRLTEAHSFGLLIGFLWALTGASGGVSAQQDKEVQRAEQAVQDTSPASYSSGGTRFQFKPYVETEGGHDSNPDNLFDEDASAFVKIETGLKATAETPTEFYKLTLRGRFIDYSELPEDIRHRTDFKAALDTEFVLSDQETLSAGTYFLRDLISLARADIYHSYLEYALRAQNYRIKVGAKSHVERNFDDEEQGSDSFDDFSVSRAQAFDFSRSDGQVNILTFTQSIVQPFAILNYGNIDYYNQVEGVSIDRTSNEFYAIGGIRLQPNKSFRFDLGYRFNDRDIDNNTFSHEQNGYLDINMFWKPFEALKITGVVERHFDEPSTSFGIVEDVKTYGMTFDWDLAEKWRLTGTSYYDREETVGDDRLDKKFTATMALTYYATDNLEVFLSTLAKHVEEEFSGDSYDRYKVGAGARFKF